MHGAKRWSCDWKKELDWAEGDNVQEQESGGSQIVSHMMFSHFFGASCERPYRWHYKWVIKKVEHAEYQHCTVLHVI